MKRLLVVKLADLGDLLTATPALRALRNGHPAAHIAALVTPSSAVLLRGSSAVDEVIVFDKVAFDRPSDAARSVPTAVGLAARLRSGGWDALVLLHHLTTRFGTAKYAALSLASGAGIRAGLDNGRGWFLTRSACDEGFGVRHEADYWLAVAATVGGNNPDPKLELTLSEHDHAWAVRTLKRLGRFGSDTVVIHPGSGRFSLARRWAPERFARVADVLEGEDGLRALVLHGPGPDEREVAERVAAACARPLDLLGPAPSPQALAALLGRTRLFIGNDSGVLHLAAAAGTPIVGIYGPSNDRAWGPYPLRAPHHAVVRESLACSPCVHRGHALGTPEGCAARTCLDLVEPRQVVTEAQRILRASAGSTSVPSVGMAGTYSRSP